MRTSILLLFLWCFVQSANAQTIQKETLSSNSAQLLCKTAQDEATSMGLAIVVAILDESGNIISIQKMDNAPLASIQVATQKAKTAAMWGFSSKDFEDWLQGGMTRLLTLPNDQTLIEGGIPIKINGKTVGAIGVSGGSSQQDALIAQKSIDKLINSVKK
jgi:glc operon protein GlcG